MNGAPRAPTWWSTRLREPRAGVPNERVVHPSLLSMAMFRSMFGRLMQLIGAAARDRSALGHQRAHMCSRRG